jgi:hypothetical protein
MGRPRVQPVVLVVGLDADDGKLHTSAPGAALRVYHIHGTTGKVDKQPPEICVCQTIPGRVQQENRSWSLVHAYFGNTDDSLVK